MTRKNWPMVPLVALVLLASGVALGESYHGIRSWALNHGVESGLAANAWPLQVDLFIIAGDLGLILSAFYLWPKRVRVLSWWSVGLGLAVSVLCNSFQDAWMGQPLAVHLTQALPPISATAGLMIVLSVMKQYAARPVLQVVPDERPTPPVKLAKVPPLKPVPRPVPVPQPASLSLVGGTAQERRWRSDARYLQGLEICRDYADRDEYLSLAVLARGIGMKNKTMAQFIVREFKASKNGTAVHVP